MNTVYAFGDSFTFGHELSDCPTNLETVPSKKSYGALVAEQLNFNYTCCAVGGYANNAITRRLINQIDQIDETDIVLIMWTYTERHEFIFSELGARTIQVSDTMKFAKDYFQLIDLGDHNMVANAAKEIYLAQQLLANKNVKFVFVSAVTNLARAVKESTQGLLTHVDKSHWIFLDNNDGFYDWAKNTLKLNFRGHPPDLAHSKISTKIIEKLNE